MKVPVADMADDRADEAARLGFRVGFLDAVGKPGNRDAGIRDDAFRAWRKRTACPIGVMPRFPHLCAFFLGTGPVERTAIIGTKDRADQLDLLGDAGG